MHVSKLSQDVLHFLPFECHRLAVRGRGDGGGQKVKPLFSGGRDVHFEKVMSEGIMNWNV